MPVYRLGLHDLVADGITDQVADRVEVQSVHEVGAMRLRRLDADPPAAKRFRSLLAIPASRSVVRERDVRTAPS